LGLFGDLYSDLDRHSKAALRMAERFERRYPQAPDTYPPTA